MRLTLHSVALLKKFVGISSFYFIFESYSLKKMNKKKKKNEHMQLNRCLPSACFTFPTQIKSFTDKNCGISSTL